MAKSRCDGQTGWNDKNRWQQKSKWVYWKSNYVLWWVQSFNVGNQYLPVAISSAVQGTVKSSEDRISKLLYKNTVELSMVMNVLSAIADVDNDTLKKLRVKCMNEVKATNGKISFEEINKYQKGSWFIIAI